MLSIGSGWRRLFVVCRGRWPSLHGLLRRHVATYLTKHCRLVQLAERVQRRSQLRILLGEKHLKSVRHSGRKQVGSRLRGLACRASIERLTHPVLLGGHLILLQQKLQ